ncbi:hypothetical protein [Arthrobacter sp. VKM Ac-2550]|uniref:hypothetical protein n=1 Tax=Crystallibacter permensis TaxID=1938888 RepID=UPI002225E255|nr:hypothetical protein [Arthrobacter sp. VKM Ac-2550]MCW2131204.1 hypothetical protein [Arthrobacter sp. VKM Ac-2550]
MEHHSAPTGLLRRSYRDGGKVKHDAGEPSMRCRPATSRAVARMARSLGFEEMLGPGCRERDIALGLITARVCAPASKLASLRWFEDTTLAADLGPATTGEAYAAMDWLLARQPRIEKQLDARYLGPEANPQKLAHCC